MSLTISGTWNASSGMALQGQWITVSYFVHVPAGLLCSECGQGFLTGQYEVKLAYGQTDGSGNYTITLPEDTIVAYAVLTGYYRFRQEDFCVPAPVSPGTQQIAWFRNPDGTPYGPGMLISGTPGTLNAEPYFQGCEGAAQFAYTGDLEAVARLSPLAPPLCLFYTPYIEGIKAERAPRNGTVWSYLTGAVAASATVSGYAPTIHAVGYCSGGSLKNLNGVTLLVTGVYGSESVTTDANGLAALSMVDPNVITQIRATGGIPDCASLGSYPDFTQPAGTELLVNPAVFNPSGAAFNPAPFDAISPVCGTGLITHTFLYCRCTGSVNHTDLQADSVGSMIAVAWTDSGGALRVSANRQPQRDIGSASQHWDTATTPETAGASDLGLVFLPNRSLYFCYDLAGSKTYRLNKKYGTASAADWSAAATPAPAVARHSSSGRGQRQSWRFRALGDWGPPLTAGSIEFSQCRDNHGAVWTAPVTAVTGALGPTCGGVWLGNRYGLLYTAASDGHVYWLAATDPTSWPAGSGTDTGMTDQVASVAINMAGILVALLWDTSGQTCRAARSRDRGRTWEADTTVIAAIPALARPPVLVASGSHFYAVYVVDNTPQFAASRDGGLIWR